MLVSPGVSGYPMPANPELDAQFEAFAEAGDVEGIARLAGGMWTTGEPDDAVLSQLRSAAKAWLANDEYEKSGPSAFERLGSIAAPAVLLIGDKDYPPLIECDEAIVARIPGCRKIDVPGGDHLLPLRVPDLVADMIEEFAG